MEFIDFLMDGNNFRSEMEVKYLNPLVMAFIGDGIYSLYVKSRELDLFADKVNTLTKKTAEIVNAQAQEQALFKIYDRLTESEQDIVRRARNTNIHTHAKNYTIDQYRHATALEALIGYLFLTKRVERLKELLNLIFEKE